MADVGALARTLALASEFLTSELAQRSLRQPALLPTTLKGLYQTPFGCMPGLRARVLDPQYTSTLDGVSDLIQGAPGEAINPEP